LVRIVLFILLTIIYFIGYKTTQTPSEGNNDEKQLHIIDYNEKDFGEELKGSIQFF